MKTFPLFFSTLCMSIMLSANAYSSAYAGQEAEDAYNSVGRLPIEEVSSQAPDETELKVAALGRPLSDELNQCLYECHSFRIESRLIGACMENCKIKFPY